MEKMKIGMFEDQAKFLGINLKVDSIDRNRTEGSDNVMAIFEEEQPFTWKWVQPYLREVLESSKKQSVFLDVGTGSGVFAILMAKNYSLDVVAIDKSQRAIEIAKVNAERNEVNVKFIHSSYSRDLVPKKSAQIIGLYPPYHLYPKHMEEKIPQHARGGMDGQGEFKSQLEIASHHVAEGGCIFFNMMNVGDEGGPDFARYIPEMLPNCSLKYTQIFPRIGLKIFFDEVYGKQKQGKLEKYCHEMVSKYPFVYYTVGAIRNDEKGVIEEVVHSIQMERSWEDRFALHREIGKHSLR